MGKAERKFDEVKILQYKETNDETLFEDIINDKNIRKYVTYVASSKLRNAPTTMYSLDDLVSIGYLVVWQSIQKYRFICPCCKLKAKSASAYKLHTLTKHGEYLEPSVSISRFIKFNLGAYLQNEIRKEYSAERKSNIMTINIFSPDDQVNGDAGDDVRAQERVEGDIVEIIADFSVEDEVIFKNSLEDVVDKFDNFTRQIFEYVYSEKLKQVEIAEILYQEGKYSSVQSATVVVSRTIKNKINPVLQSLYPELIR